MPDILFDSQIFNQQCHGGISRYFSELISGLQSTAEFRVFPDKYYTDNDHIFTKGLSYLDNFRRRSSFRGKHRVEKLIFGRDQKRIFRRLREGDFDVFHPTYYQPDFIPLIPREKPFVLTVHDMIHELYYEDHFEQIQLETIWKAALIPKQNIS
jgi:hypothetical protein